MEHKLKIFCTVAETKSFSKTSEIIHLTQPAVSLQIQAIEEKYETKLFDRSSSTVTLTPAASWTNATCRVCTVITWHAPGRCRRLKI